MSMPVYNPDDDPDVFAEVQRWRAQASVPFIEQDPPTPRPEQPCWCTDFHRDVHLYLTYCPRHGGDPDPDLWDHSTGPFPLIERSR